MRFDESLAAYRRRQKGYVYYSVPYPLSQEKRTLFRMGDDGQPVYKDDGLTVETYEEDSELCVFEDSYGVVQYFNGESSSDRVCAVYAVGSALYLFVPKSVDRWESFSSGLANPTARRWCRFPGLRSRRSPRHGLTRSCWAKARNSLEKDDFPFERNACSFEYFFSS